MPLSYRLRRLDAGPSDSSNIFLLRLSTEVGYVFLYIVRVYVILFPANTFDYGVLFVFIESRNIYTLHARINYTPK